MDPNRSRNPHRSLPNRSQAVKKLLQIEQLFSLLLLPFRDVWLFKRDTFRPKNPPHIGKSSSTTEKSSNDKVTSLRGVPGRETERKIGLLSLIEKARILLLLCSLEFPFYPQFLYVARSGWGEERKRKWVQMHDGYGYMASKMGSTG